MLTNDPNLSEDLVKLLICPLCNSLCEIGINKDSDANCVACGKTFSATDTSTIIVAEEHLLKNYQKLTKTTATVTLKWKNFYPAGGF